MKQSKIPVPLGLGSIQDLSFQKDNKMKIVSGFGRDGQISQARLGLDLKYINHQEVDISDNLVLNKCHFRSIVWFNNQQNYLFYDNQLLKIVNNKIIQEEVLDQQILNFTVVDNKKLIITGKYIKYDNTIINLQIQNYKIYGRYIIVQQNNNIILYHINQGIKMLSQLENVFGQFSMYYKNCCAFLIIIDQQNNVKKYILENDKLKLVIDKQIKDLPQINQLEILSYKEQLILLIRSQYKVFSIFINNEGNITSQKIVMKRDVQPYLFNQESGNELFIRTKNSVYKIEVFDYQVYALPLLTEKIESFNKFSILYNQRNYGIHQYQHYNIYSQQQKQYVDNQLYDFLLITYSIQTINNKEKLIINYYDMGKDMKYKTYDKFIKRTSVALLTDNDTNNNIVLTEQYLGKMQLRLIQKQTLIEIDQVIPYYTICTCLQECFIKNKKYFGLSQFSSRDIFTDILQQNKVDKTSTNSQQKHDIETKIEFYYIDNNKLIIDKEKTIIFNARQPLSSFLVINDIVYAGIGNQLIKQDFNGQIINQLKFNCIIESMCNDDKYLFILASGILYQVQQDTFEIVNKLEEIQDIKLIQCQSFVVIVTYSNKLIVLDKQLQIISIMNVNQTINCLKIYSDNIYAGCDTGSILHFKFINQSYLQKFQQTIIDSYLGSQRILSTQNMKNSIDGDILSLYKFLPEDAQNTIYKILNIKPQELLDLLFKLEYGE